MYGALSFSRSKKGWTLGFNGTYSLDLTKVYSDCRVDIPNKENMGMEAFEDILINWIKRFFAENSHMPSVIMLYREGLSNEQVKSQGEK